MAKVKTSVKEKEKAPCGAATRTNSKNGSVTHKGSSAESDARAEKRKTLPLKAFRMVYDSHHKKD
ncbi:MAG TPA: hypothetical protein VGC97_03905 [Pyrinomonadaceae bacterium]|jgi:hypothetical protein